MCATSPPAAPVAPVAESWLALEEMEARFRRVLGGSVAEETELVWIECQRQQIATRRVRGTPPPPPHERTVLVRVIDGGRLGQHRTVSAGVGGLETAVRLAIAQARFNPPLATPFHFPATEGASLSPVPLEDPVLRDLDEPTAVRRMQQELARHELGVFRWTVGRMAVLNSRGLVRLQPFTAASLVVSCGPRAGAGRSEGAARRLDVLDPPRLVAAARALHGQGDPVESPATAGPLLLSGLAVTSLLELLNTHALSARSYREGTSVLRQHLGVQVFDRRFTLRDDATDPAGLPFPFDLEGSLKRPVELVAEGKPATPALDQRQAAIIGLAATGSAISGDDARAEHLHMAPGGEDERALLAAAEGGLAVGWIERAECYDPRHGDFRAVLRGVREIRDGERGRPVVDLVWEDSLLRVFGALPAIGSELAVVARGTFGAIVAPSAVILNPRRLRVG
jgi:predicted Zn-dependent protease